jgi:YVTN family beta-propeller protein
VTTGAAVVWGAGLAAALLAADPAPGRARQTPAPATAPVPLVTGKAITPTGEHTGVGSFPVNMALTPDGRFALVTSTGTREYVTVLSVADGKVVSQVGYNDARADLKGKKQDLYYGLALGPAGADGAIPVYVSRGSENKIGVLLLGTDGKLTDTGRTLDYPGAGTDALNDDPPYPAGVAVTPDGARLFAANNTALKAKDLKSSVSVFDTATGKQIGTVETDGYPFAVAALAAGPDAGKKVYVTSEQTGTVAVIDPASLKVLSTIRVGSHPTALRFSADGSRLYVANGDSDTVSVVDTRSDKVTQTILLRPAEARNLPGATPTGLALSPDGRRLYVSLADMNAVAVVDLRAGKVAGYVPVGWYPTAVAVSPDGARFLVTSAKGVQTRNPNGKPVQTQEGETTYVQAVLEGTVSSVPVPADAAALAALTERTLANNFVARIKSPEPFKNPGIEHVIYIVKENRTFDQVLSDIPGGNGDKSLLMFGREVTPNLHALAERFVLLDNFYCCAEVSGDGWNWSTAGMANEYVSRNVPHGYAGRVRTYDYEGTNNGVAPDRQGKPDVATPAGGYIWDAVAKKGLSQRNFGFFVDDFDDPRATPEAGPAGQRQVPNKRLLEKVTSNDFRGYDLRFPDSEAAMKHGLPYAPREIKTYGSQNDPARTTTFLREFAGYVKNNNLPRFMVVRFGRDHTAGTAAGQHSPRAMVADNDYAVGQLVEAVSKSPYWKKTAIFVVEDDAQAGTDHVDAHRSTAYVISPFIRRNTIDSRFYNTDSTLRTMELILGLPPMNQYDAIAPPLAVFTAAPDNDAPFEAILPAKEIVGEINDRRAYRAADSARLISMFKEESAPDEELNDILWHALKGRNTPMPARRYGVRVARPAVDGDDD